MKKHNSNFRYADQLKIDRIEQRIERLKAKANQMLASGNYIHHFDLKAKIKAAEAELQRIYEDAGRKPLTDLLTPEELATLAPMMLEIHLICDLLTEAAYELTDYCEKQLKIEGFYLMDPLIQARNKANEFASTLTLMGDKLCSLICDNETLNAALRRKIQKHIAQRIKPADYE